MNIELDHLLDITDGDTDYEVLVRLKVVDSTIEIIGILDVYDPCEDQSLEEVPERLRRCIEREVDDMTLDDLEDDLPEERSN